MVWRLPGRVGSIRIMACRSPRARGSTKQWFGGLQEVLDRQKYWFGTLLGEGGIASDPMRNPRREPPKTLVSKLFKFF